MGNQISYNKDDFDEVTEPLCQGGNKENCSEFETNTYYITKGKTLENAQENDFKCVKTRYENKDVVACKLKDGAFYDSIESILEDTAYTENNQKAAAKACSKGLVWKNRLPYVGSLASSSDAPEKANVKKMLGIRLKEVIQNIRGDYPAGSAGEMKIINVGTHQNKCNMLNDIAPCRSNYASKLYGPTGDIKMNMQMGQINKERTDAKLNNNGVNADTISTNRSLDFSKCMMQKLTKMDEEGNQKYLLQSYEVLDEDDIKECELGPIERTNGIYKNIGPGKTYSSEEVFCHARDKDKPELWNCYAHGIDKLIENQKLDDLYLKSNDEKKDITKVYPYVFDVIKNPNYCKLGSCKREAVGWNKDLVDKARIKNRSLIENAKKITDGGLSDAQLLALQAKQEEEQSKMQEKIDQLMKLNQQKTKEQKQETGETVQTVQTIVTPASNPVADLFKKYKLIIIIGSVVFLLLIIILLIV